MAAESAPDEPPVVAVSQDECSFHANDDIKTEWCENDKGMSLKQKSRGALLMVSDASSSPSCTAGCARRRSS